MNKLPIKFLTCAFFALVLSACGGGGGNSNPAPATPSPTPSNVTVSGTISFDKVPQTSTSNAALNYAAIAVLPAAGIVVEALDSSGTVLANTVTNTSGNYNFTLSANTSVRIRAKAQLLDNNWDFKVTDNTNNNALYVLDGQLVNSGTNNSNRDLHASSGWGGSAYTTTRAAAPFALLKVIFTGIQQIIAADSSLIFPRAEIRWSINNRGSIGNPSDGDITTSSFVISNGLPIIYILGTKNVDTDEYDEDVVAHEWGHYLESQLSRSDSIGGNHSLGDFLDMRVAFSEGLGNALSGVINGDNFYVDSFGANQANGFTINLETKSNTSSTGWFSEDSIQSILFDISDSNNEGQDTLSLGMAGIINVLRASSYKQSTSLTSVFTFAETFKTLNPNSSVGLDNLLSANNINSDSAFATGETNNAFRSNILPVYSDITVGGSAVNLCSTKLDGKQNKLSNFRFAKVDIASNRQYNINLQRTSGPTSTDPDFLVFLRGQIVLESSSPANNAESGAATLAPGTYVIAITDFFNTDNSATTGGVSCFDLTII